jgi:hypothetical protein
MYVDALQQLAATNQPQQLYTKLCRALKQLYMVSMQQ